MAALAASMVRTTVSPSTRRIRQRDWLALCFLSCTAWRANANARVNTR
ncbi:hypothetical protein [Janthinobacterium agaricidamnosum]|nr:hypothetical protein [Janthinobacterium agaricidamnosum]